MPAIRTAAFYWAVILVTRILESGWRCPLKRRKCFFAFILNMMTCKVVGKVHVVRKVFLGA